MAVGSGRGNPPASGGVVAKLDPIASVEETKNWVRRYFSFVVLGIFAFEVFATIIGAIILLCEDKADHIDKLIQVMAFVVTPTVTVLGSVCGYFFGTRGRHDAL
jgi:hypothetical protein